MMSKICGHRGAAYHKPENTISGFEWCVENKIDFKFKKTQKFNSKLIFFF